MNYVTSYNVLCDGDNLSDHLPVSMSLNMPVSHTSNVVKSGIKLKWHEASHENLINYKEYINNMLENIALPKDVLLCKNVNCKLHTKDIEQLHNDIISICLSAALQYIPVTKCNNSTNTKSHIIPGWNEHVKSVYEQALFWHSMWKQNNCPKSGTLFEIRNMTRRKYHSAVKIAKQNADNYRANKMAISVLSNNKRDFWKEVNKVKQSNKKLSVNTIDDVICENEIANLFAKKYEDLYTSVSYDGVEMSKLIKDINIGIEHDYNSIEYTNIFTCLDIKNAIKHLKCSKNDGETGFTSDHIIHGTEKLFTMLTLLFNCMLCHGYVPKGLQIGNIIPIPKNKRKSLNNSDNYRAIALSSIFGKVLDWIFLHKFDNIFKTSDLQFGFKAKHSTTQCTFVVNETVQYYNNKNTSVHVVLLDATKAFDRVNYVKLFKLLIHRKLPSIIIRFLLNMYTHGKLRVKWNNCKSYDFDVKNGVKQGGVLSPILFGIYVDELLGRLSKSGFGCHIGNKFMGAVAYADDITLLAPTKHAMLQLLNIADNFATDYDVKFNATKTVHIVFGEQFTENNKISFRGEVIKQVSNDKHLGNIIGTENINKTIVRSAINDFMIRFNEVLCLFNYINFDIKYSLLKTYCMPLYGSQLWDYDSNFVNEFFVTWRKCLRKLLNLPYTTHCNLLPGICNDFPVEVQLYLRLVKFVNSCLVVDNSSVSLCIKLALQGSGSSLSSSISYLSYKYSIDKNMFNDNINFIKKIIKNAVNVKEDVCKKCTQIRELLGIKDDFTQNRFCDMTLNEINDLINFLCTD